MAEGRKLAAILAADVAGYSRLAGADEELTLARLRALRSDLIDPVISVHRGRVVKRTGDGALVEFRSAVEAVRCAIEVQDGMALRNSGVPADRRIEFRIGIHLGDVVEEADGDLMGDGVNIAARLEGISEPGGICLSEDAWRQVRDKLQEQFADWGERELKNIARPVRVYAIEANPNHPSPPLGAERLGEVGDSRARTTSPSRAAGAGPSLSARTGGEGNTPPRLSIVVLPFANIGGDPEQDYFVDGVTESLTTDLSRISSSFVIGRNTAFTYKGKAVDLKQIGRELNVRYVLEGSVQKGGNRLRVNVQLIEAESGAHLWAERFDKPVADLFDMQDEIVARLANQLQAQLIEVEARRAAQSPHPDSMDLYFQGMAWFNKGPALDTLTHARVLFERALEADQDNVDALASAAYVDYLIGGQALTENPRERLIAAEAAARKVLSLAPNHVLARQVLALVYMFTNRGEQAIIESEHALALDRNSAASHAVLGFTKSLHGKANETEEHILDALRLSPRDVGVYLWTFIAGSALVRIGRNEEALTWLRRSIDANRNGPAVYFFLAAALAHLDKLDEARIAATAGLALDPHFTIAGFRTNVATDNLTSRAESEYVFDGMRLAGLPEG
jgi:TolB-like protein/class 3 adenylate cyclase/Flp pilus assembly protein TadD